MPELLTAVGLNLDKMSDREIIELAAILLNEHGSAALEVAQRRRAQFAHSPHSYGFRLWTRIAAATARLLRVKQEQEQEKV
jgi:hypothetical protein